MKSSKKTKTKPSFSFTLTPSGIAALCITALILPLGFIRGELFAFLAGIAFLGYGFFSFVFAISNFIVWKNRTVHLAETPSGTYKIIVSKESPSLRFLSLFSKIYFHIVYNALTEQGNTTNKWYYFTCPVLPPGEYTHGERARGAYIPLKSEIQVTDPANFFIFHILQSELFLPKPLIVFPNPEEPYSINFLSGQSTAHRGKSTFNRSEDLYENRNYIPGDDPRKINWKIYSHTGILALREGELLPPPHTEYALAFNTSKNSLFPKIQTNLFDILVNRASAIALNMSKKHIPIFTLQTSKPFSFSSNSTHEESEILTALSYPQIESCPKKDKAHPQAQQSVQPINQTSAILLFFTLPGAVTLDQIKLYKKDQVNICVGPYPHPVSTNTLMNERYKIEVKNTVLRLKKEGYHVSTI